MVTKIQRSFRNLNRLLDDDYRKLSDKLENIKLSHNRKVRLLEKCDLLIKSIIEKFDMEIEDKVYLREMRHKIDLELKTPLRVNYFKKGK